MPEPNVLPPELTIYTVGEWHPRLLDWVGSGPEADAVDDTLQLDAAAVTEVDAAGLQLLVSLANTLGQHRQYSFCAIAIGRQLPDGAFRLRQQRQQRAVGRCAGV